MEPTMVEMTKGSRPPIVAGLGSRTFREDIARRLLPSLKRHRPDTSPTTTVFSSQPSIYRHQILP